MYTLHYQYTYAALLLCLNQPTLTLGWRGKSRGRGGEAEREGWVPGGGKQNHLKLTLFGWEEV